MTLTELFALANGASLEPGPHRCFYCGAACGESFPASAHVSSGWTRWQYVARPSSAWVCAGCVTAMNEKAAVRVHGETAPRTGQRVRCYSWIVTRNAAIACPKGTNAPLRDAILDPPEPPFGIAVSTTGQRVILYTGRVNENRDRLAVSLDEEVVHATPAEFAARLELCGRIAAAAGKPALSAPPAFGFYRLLAEYYEDGIVLADAWTAVRSEPLSRLAAFLCFKKEDACEQHPRTRAAAQRDAAGA